VSILVYKLNETKRKDYQMSSLTQARKEQALNLVWELQRFCNDTTEVDMGCEVNEALSNAWDAISKLEAESLAQKALRETGRLDNH
jgi:hypothetical protein